MPFRDVDPDELRSLTDVFRRAGADDPESWAHSQLAEGIPQLAIFSFAKALWNGLIREDDDKWIDQEIEWAKQHPSDPCAHVGPALQEMLAKGVSRAAITDLVRVMQYEVLFHVCSILDRSRTEDVPITDWTLHQVDEDGKPVAIIQGLHEVLLTMDLTGREMRPRGSSS
jgi:hypothetical protein